MLRTTEFAALSRGGASCTTCSNNSGDCDSAKFVEVKAPASLSEGFVFWATVGDSSFEVTVPTGGVHAGQTIRVPILSTTKFVPQKGRWKDGLFSCFRLGLCHPALCNAVVCPQLLLGQILFRMNMTWLVSPMGAVSGGSGGSGVAASNGTSTNPSSSTSNNGVAISNSNNTPKPGSVKTTMKRIMTALILFSLYDALMSPPLIEFNVNQEGELTVERTADASIWHQLFYILLSLPMSIYGVIVVVKLRAAVRAKYGIPTGRLGRMEDFCCVCCCNCCVVAQMARQTADYDGDEPASCCSTNGLIGVGSNNNNNIKKGPTYRWWSSFRCRRTSRSINKSSNCSHNHNLNAPLLV